MTKVLVVNMKAGIIYTCLLLGVVQIGRSTAILECHTCNGSESIDKCNNITNCGDKQSCFTQIKTNGKIDIYTMGCTDNKNCGYVKEYNAVSKLSVTSQEKCYACCSSRKCNYQLCKHPKPSQCEDDESMDCAKLNEMFDICKDIHDAKLICPNFCNLCLLVDGNWAEWSLWSSCDVTCGYGKHTRVRSCTNPAPAYQGLECQGERSDTKPCSQPPCPVHGGWSAWSNWNACLVTCGLGIQKRYRNCSNPYPLRFGDHCFGDQVDFRNCFRKPCDDGVWGNWESWGLCSPSCDSGIRQRSRSCSSLVGTVCKGKSLDVRFCNKECTTVCSTKPKYNASFTNVALGKQVELSSSYNSIYEGKCMVDGNYNTFACTTKERNPFAMIDLEDIYAISSIFVGNRLDCCGYRLRNVAIQVGIDRANLATIARHQAPIGAKCTFLLENALRARYVKIMIETTEFLQLGEVEVYIKT